MKQVVRQSQPQAAVLVLLWLILAHAAPAFAGGGDGLADRVYTVREVVPGLKGTGYTVVQGDEIEAFDVEILGVLEHGGPAGSLVLIRAGGELMDRTGGIAAGMSGSPVYVDGRLLGGIGYGFAFADHRIGLVTPAEDMLEVLDLALARPSEKGAGALPDRAMRHRAMPEAAPVSKVVVAPDAAGAAALRGRFGDDVWVASPVATPLVISGFGARTLGRVRSLAEGLDLVPVLGGSSPPRAGALPETRAGGGDPILPGSSIGVQLMRGDANLTVVGTVTHVEDGGFVAFGHPILSRGAANYFAARAGILTTVTGVAHPFKVASFGDVVGVVAQDRSAGVGGLFGAEPESVALLVNVQDEDRGTATRFSVQAAKDELLTVPLLAIGALEAVDRGIDRIGEGTAWVELAIQADALPRPLVRSNMFYSEADIAAESLAEAYEALQLLVENEFEDPKLRSVEISVRIEQGRRTARVVDAAPRRKKALPGEQAIVDVTLRPYRQDAFTITVPLDIPEWAAPGEVTVSVQGGGGGFGVFLPEGIEEVFQGGILGDGEGWDASSSPAESLESVAEEFEARPKNNDLVLEFYVTYDSGQAGAPPSGDPDPDEWLIDESEPVRVIHPSEYVILGDACFTLEIEAADMAASDLENRPR